MIELNNKKIDYAEQAGDSGVTSFGYGRFVKSRFDRKNSGVGIERIIA